MKKYFIQKAPFVVPTTDGKVIKEHIGLASTGEQRFSAANMIAPPFWTEPHQTPQFDELTIMISGKKQIEIDGDVVVLEAGQTLFIKAGARIKYSNPFPEESTYWSICIPAFSMETVNREEE
ncbi:MAG: cupin [Bacteroidetes bacterium B1(2017)]|nr:MAG: cupin [Bacteroidetes bacterium B1(2017)]